jgi:hypothetical protein
MQFDHEKLNVYQVSLQFVAWTFELYPGQGIRRTELDIPRSVLVLVLVIELGHKHVHE